MAATPHREPANDLPVEVVRSRRRRKTVEAQMVDGVIRVSVPASMSEQDEQAYVADLVAKIDRKYRSGHVDLDARAATLARRYALPRPRSVRWADNQRSRWGSCSVGTREIRISTRLADCPSYVPVMRSTQARDEVRRVRAYRP
jgi:predicted metal-dependent hydrolase